MLPLRHAATPRLAPKLTKQMPDLNAAAAGWAQKRMLAVAADEGAADGASPSSAAAAAAAVPVVAPELLPLPHMRLQGRLFTDNQDLVPAVVRPPQPLRLPLRLGSVVLPLATLDEAKLKSVAVRGLLRRVGGGGGSAVAAHRRRLLPHGC